MDDDAFLQEFYRAMVVGDKSEKIAYIKKLPKSLTVEEITDLVESGANVTAAIESRINEMGRYIKACAALAIDRTVRGDVEPPTYEGFKKHYDFVIKRFDDMEPEIKELKKRCGKNEEMFNYLLFQELIPKGENLDMMYE